MDADLLARVVFPWLATWFVDSTVLLLVVWGITRVWRRLRPSTHVVLWRAALFGPLLTATLPFLFDLPTAPTRIALSAAPAVDVPIASLPSTPPALPHAAPPHAELPAPVDVAPPHAMPAPQGPALETEGSVAGAALRPWMVLAWCLAACLLVLRGSFRSRRVRRRLADRRPLLDAHLNTVVEHLAHRAGLRHVPALTMGTGLSSPVAWGVWRPEIYVPQRAYEDLSPDQQEAMLAHELGHIVRRDALWLGLARIVGCLFFFQPLHVLARRRVRENTELACDRFAVDVTRRPLALAECLAEVAGWIVHPGGPAPAPAMASTPSLLARRVELLLETPATGKRSTWATMAASTGLLAVVALLAPGFTDRGVPQAEAAPVAPTSAVPTQRESASGAASPVETELHEIERELQLLAASLAELEGLADALENHRDVQEAVRRLVDRSKTLFERRDALRRAAQGDDR